jgi:hypothetical protein
MTNFPMKDKSMIAKEIKYVVNPLETYFTNVRRSGAKWTIKDKSKGPGETGWDLQVARKNQTLVIEAKHIKQSFKAAMEGLTLSPLVRHSKQMKRNPVICWAIGVGWRGGWSQDDHMAHIYQILFDYFARNLQFWKFYSNILKVRYIFFIKNKDVAKISFIKMHSHPTENPKKVLA